MTVLNLCENRERVKRGEVRHFEHMEIDSKRVPPGGVCSLVVDLHKDKEL